MSPVRLQPTKAQSIVEWTFIAVIVMVGIVVGGPYLLDSIKGHYQIIDESVTDSTNDHLIKATKDQVDLTVPACTFTWSPSDCGINGCQPTERFYSKTATPTGCESGFKCEVDDTSLDGNPACCSTPSRTGVCYRNPSDTPNLATTNIPAGFNGFCTLGDRVWQYTCGANSGLQLCQSDHTTTDGDRDCQPVCRTEQIPLDTKTSQSIAELCSPSTGVALQDDKDMTFVGSQADCAPSQPTKCEAYCKTGYIFSGGVCLSTCGNNTCDAGETCASCPKDCSCFATIVYADRKNVPGGLSPLVACKSKSNNCWGGTGGAPTSSKYPFGGEQNAAWLCQKAGFKYLLKFSIHPSSSGCDSCNWVHMLPNNNVNFDIQLGMDLSTISFVVGSGGGSGCGSCSQLRAALCANAPDAAPPTNWPNPAAGSQVVYTP